MTSASPHLFNRSTNLNQEITQVNFNDIGMEIFPFKIVENSLDNPFVLGNPVVLVGFSQ